MYFDSLATAMQMDGHGVFVWGAYAITVVVIGLMLLVPQRRQRRLLAQYQADRRRAAGQPMPDATLPTEESNAPGT